MIGQTNRQTDDKQRLQLYMCFRLDFTERELEFMTLEMKDKICAIVEDVEWKVGRWFNRGGGAC